MSDGLKNVAAAARTIEIDGTEYRLGKIGLDALAEMEDYVTERRVNPIHKVGEHVNEFNEAQQKVLLEAAVKESARMGDSAGGEEVETFFNTFDGKVFFVWLSIRGNHPEFKELKSCREIVAKAAEDPAKLIELATKLLQASGLAQLAEAAKNSPGSGSEPEQDPHESRGLDSISSSPADTDGTPAKSEG